MLDIQQGLQRIRLSIESAAGPGRVLRGLMKRIDRSVACSGVFD
jgi:hypothetical protein